MMPIGDLGIDIDWKCTINGAKIGVRPLFWCSMKSSTAKISLPLAVQRALKKLGGDIAIARKRRRLTMAIVAERAFIGRNTLARVERGDPGVSLGIYATVLFVLGLANRLDDLADPSGDAVGLSLEAERLPQRARATRKRT
jgi:hypothetical protein